jgi:hypothetical protein
METNLNGDKLYESTFHGNVGKRSICGCATLFRSARLWRCIHCKSDRRGIVDSKLQLERFGEWRRRDDFCRSASTLARRRCPDSRQAPVKQTRHPLPFLRASEAAAICQQQAGKVHAPAFGKETPRSRSPSFRSNASCSSSPSTRALAVTRPSSVRPSLSR